MIYCYQEELQSVIECMFCIFKIPVHDEYFNVYIHLFIILDYHKR